MPDLSPPPLATLASGLTVQQQMAALARSIEQATLTLGNALEVSLRKITRALEVAFNTPSIRSYVEANDPAHVAGIMARYSVRVALDPAYATDREADLLVRAVLAGNTDTRWMTRPNRALVAAAVCRSMAVHRG